MKARGSDELGFLFMKTRGSDELGFFYMGVDINLVPRVSEAWMPT